MGSWVVYGLGTENQNLPGFITIKPALLARRSEELELGLPAGRLPGHGDRQRGHESGRHQGEPIEYLLNKQLRREQQRYELDMLQNINRRHEALRQQDPQLEARIQAFELAFRMQTAGARSLSGRARSRRRRRSSTAWTTRSTRDFGRQCLLARRLAERGVRFIQCTHSYKWDQHGEL